MKAKRRQMKLKERCGRIVVSDRKQIRGPEQRKLIPLIQLKDLGM